MRLDARWDLKKYKHFFGVAIQPYGLSYSISVTSISHSLVFPASCSTSIDTQCSPRPRAQQARAVGTNIETSFVLTPSGTTPGRGGQ